MEKEQYKRLIERTRLKAISDYIHLEKQRQDLQKKAQDLLNEKHEFIKEHEITVEKNEFFIKCIEKENDENIRNLLEKDLQKLKKTNESINKKTEEEKRNYHEIKDMMKQIKNEKIKMAKDYFKEGIDIDILTRYANLTSKEIKQIKEID